MKTCNCENIATQIEDHITAARICAIHGRTYLLRSPDGGWETQEERQERMKFDRTCEACEAEYQLHQHPVVSHPLAKNLCPACLRTTVRVRVPGPTRNNVNSPWRLGRQTERPIRRGVCRCGRSWETRSTNKYQCDKCQAEANLECMKITNKARRER